MTHPNPTVSAELPEAILLRIAGMCEQLAAQISNPAHSEVRDFYLRDAAELRRLHAQVEALSAAQRSAGVPKVVLELPAGDTRIANVYWSEMRGDTLHLCISVDTPAQAGVPAGYVLVPIKPTLDMVNALADTDPERESVWDAVLAAAPPQAVREPLTEAQRQAIYDKHCFIGENGWEVNWWEVINEVEAAHGISKGGQHGS